jgi:hypothetical protein
VTHNPFEEVEPLEPLGYPEVFTSLIKRSIMWDLIGPARMWQQSVKYGQSPASPDVLRREYEDMLKRKRNLLPIGGQLALMCYVAAESATEAVFASDDKFSQLSDDEKVSVRMQNVAMSSAVTESVIGHLLQSGILVYGEPPNEFLGTEVGDDSTE